MTGRCTEREWTARRSRGAFALVVLLLNVLNVVVFGPHAGHGPVAPGNEPASDQALATALGEVCTPGRNAPRSEEERPTHPVPAEDPCQSCALCLAGALPADGASRSAAPPFRTSAMPFLPSLALAPSIGLNPPARGPPSPFPTDRTGPSAPAALG